MADCKQQLVGIGDQASTGLFMSIFRQLGIYHSYAHGPMTYTSSEGYKWLGYIGNLTSITGDIVTAPPFFLTIVPNLGLIVIKDFERNIETKIVAESAECEGDANSLHLTGQEIPVWEGEWSAPLPLTSIRLTLSSGDFLSIVEHEDRLKDVVKQLSGESA